MIAGTVALSATALLTITISVIADATSVLDRVGWAGLGSIAVTVFGGTWLIGQVRARAEERSARQVSTAAIVVIIGAIGVVLYGRPIVTPKAEPKPQSPAASTTPSASEDRPPPIAVAAEQIDPICGSAWFTPKEHSQLEVPQSADGYTVGNWRHWPQLADGAAADASLMLLTIQGTAPSAVTLTRMTIDVIDRRPPTRGTTLAGICGDPDTLRWVDIDLDEAQPRITSRDLDPYARQLAEENGWRTEPVRFPYEVADHDSETFAISAHTKHCDCSWTVTFHWAASGATGTFTIPSNGASFRTVSGRNATHCGLLVSEGVLNCP